MYHLPRKYVNYSVHTIKLVSIDSLLAILFTQEQQSQLEVGYIVIGTGDRKSILFHNSNLQRSTFLGCPGLCPSE